MGCDFRVYLNREKIKDLNKYEFMDVIEFAYRLELFFGDRRGIDRVSSLGELWEFFVGSTYLDEEIEEISKILKLVIPEEKMDHLIPMIEEKLLTVIFRYILPPEYEKYLGEYVLLTTDCDTMVDTEEWIDVGELVFHDFREDLSFYERLEGSLDKLNAEMGNKEKLCLLCNSKEYDAKEGILHRTYCPILELRRRLGK